MPRRSRRSAPPRPAVFIGAELPALAHRAPVTSRVVVHEEPGGGEPWEEQRMTDASWALHESGDVLAVGTLTSVVPPERLVDLSPEGLAALSQLRREGEPVRAQVELVDGTTVEGVVVSGQYESFSHRAKALVCALPEHGLLVQVVAARRASLSGVYLDGEDVDALFDRTLARTRLGAAPRDTVFSFVTPRVTLEADAVLVECDGTNWVGVTAQGDEALVEYLEVPAGLFDVAQLESAMFALDARGAFHFTRAFTKAARLSRQVRAIPGLPGKVPVDLWSRGGDAGFALVRDGVLHFARFERATPERVAAALATLRFVGDGPRLDRLLDHGPVLLEPTHLFQPMQASFAQARAASKAAARRRAPRKGGR